MRNVENSGGNDLVILMLGRVYSINMCAVHVLLPQFGSDLEPEPEVGRELCILMSYIV